MSKFKLSGGYTYDPDFLPTDDKEDNDKDASEPEPERTNTGIKKNYALVIGDSQAESTSGLGGSFQTKLNGLGYTTTRLAYRGQSATTISDNLKNDFDVAGRPGLVIAIVGGNGTLTQTKSGVEQIVAFCRQKKATVIIVGPGLATEIENINKAQQVFNDSNIKTKDHWTTGPGKSKNDNRLAASDYIDKIGFEDGVYGYGIASNMVAGGALEDVYKSQPDGVHIVNGAQEIANEILEVVGINAPEEDPSEQDDVSSDLDPLSSTVTGDDLTDPSNYENMSFSDVENTARGTNVKRAIDAYKKSPAAYDATFDTAGATYNIDPRFLRAIAAVESGFKVSGNPSSAGALGLMQFMPGTASAYGLTNREDPVAAITAAAKLLADNKSKYGADNLPELAGTYNAGPGYGRWAADKSSWRAKIPRMNAYAGLSETRNYMQLVMAAYHEFGGTGYL